MATKKEIYEDTVSEVTTICEKHKVNANFKTALLTILANNLEPKNSGASINIDEVTHKNEAGEIIELRCSVSGVFLPATKEYFYEDKAGKGVNGLKRLSRQAEAIRKQHIKSLNATEKAIMADVLDGVITPEKGKEQLAKAKAAKPDYSGVKVITTEEA